MDFSWRCFGLLLFAVSALLLSRPAAAAEEVFTVSNVSVDETAATAAAAREHAIEAGQRQALMRLVARLAPAAAAERLPSLSDAAISDLVRDFEIADEKTSSVRYIANLTIRFKPAQIRALLRGSGILFSETPSRPVLVLPVFDPGTGPTLFGDGPWQQAWTRRVPGDGLVTYVLPRGDADDVASISVEEAVRGDEARLSSIAARYGVSDVLVATARLKPDQASGLSALDVSAQRFGTKATEQAFVANFGPQATDGPNGMFERAAAAVDQRVQEAWKQATIVHFNSEQELSARVPLGSLDRLTTVLHGLDGLAPIERVDLVRINRDEAEVHLRFLGDESQLALLLAQRGLSLSGDPSGLVLQPAAVGAGNRP
jgi:hypothetical protein